MRNCRECGTEIPASRRSPKAIYCSQKCKWNSNARARSVDEVKRWKTTKRRVEEKYATAATAAPTCGICNRTTARRFPEKKHLKAEIPDYVALCSRCCASWCGFVVRNGLKTADIHLVFGLWLTGKFTTSRGAHRTCYYPALYIVREAANVASS